VLKLLASMSLVALLSSTALAATDGADTDKLPAPAPICQSVEKVKASIPVPPLGGIRSAQGVDNFVSRTNIYVAAHGGPAKVIGTEGITEIWIWPHPKGDRVIYATFVNGCGRGVGSLDLAGMAFVAGSKAPTPNTKDDGKL